MERNKSMEALRDLCYGSAKAFYGRRFSGRYQSRLERELARIASMPGGADSFLRARTFIGGLKNSWVSHQYHKKCLYAEPRLTFRGPVLAGLTAYLCGITEYDPMQWGFYAWAFFQKAKTIEFNLDVTMEMYELMQDLGVKVPFGVTVRIDMDQTLLEAAESCGGTARRYNIETSAEDLKRIDRDIQLFFRQTVGKNDYSALRYLCDYDESIVPDVVPVLSYLKEIDQLPASLWELCKLNAFLHSTVRDCTRLQMLQAASEVYVYDSMIACPEDVYEALVKKGCPKERAQWIARTVQNSQKRLLAQEKELLEEYCGHDYAQMAAHTEHLFYRPQAFGKTVGTAEVMGWYVHEPETLRRAYDNSVEIWADLW